MQVGLVLLEKRLSGCGVLMSLVLSAGIGNSRPRESVCAARQGRKMASRSEANYSFVRVI